MILYLWVVCMHGVYTAGDVARHFILLQYYKRLILIITRRVYDLRLETRETCIGRHTQEKLKIVHS